MGTNENRQMHFGVLVVSNKYGLRLTSENYAIIDNRPTFKFGLSAFNTVEHVSKLESLYVIDETKKIGNKEYVTKRHYADAWCKKYYFCN